MLQIEIAESALVMQLVAKITGAQKRVVVRDPESQFSLFLQLPQFMF